MSTFCSNCGFPGGENTTFCTRCGARQAQTAQAPAPVGPSAIPSGINAPAAAVAKGSGVKILAVVLVCLVGFGMLALGGMYYAVHKVKQVVTEKAASYGVDLGSTTSTPTSARAKNIAACDLLSKEEVSNLIGQPVERTTRDGESCMYYGPAGLVTKLGKEHAAEAMKPAQTGGQVDPAQLATAITSAMTGIAGGENGGEGPLLILAYSPSDGKAQMTAMNILNAGIVKSDVLKGGSLEVPNLGDKALRLANLGLSVLKGDAMIRVVPGPFPDPDGKSIAVARCRSRQDLTTDDARTAILTTGSACCRTNPLTSRRC